MGGYSVGVGWGVGLGVGTVLSLDMDLDSGLGLGLPVAWDLLYESAAILSIRSEVTKDLAVHRQPGHGRRWVSMCCAWQELAWGGCLRGACLELGWDLPGIGPGA